MKRFLLFSTLLFALAACIRSDKAVADTGTFRYNNTSSSSYEIFMDGGSSGVVYGQHYYDKIDVPIGSHTLNAVQKDGYMLYPTELSKTVTVTQGSDAAIRLPIISIAN
jgi:hypothetical protein